MIVSKEKKTYHKSMRHINVNIFSTHTNTYTIQTVSSNVRKKNLKKSTNHFCVCIFVWPIYHCVYKIFFEKGKSFCVMFTVHHLFMCLSVCVFFYHFWFYFISFYILIFCFGLVCAFFFHLN